MPKDYDFPVSEALCLLCWSLLKRQTCFAVVLLSGQSLEKQNRRCFLLIVTGKRTQSFHTGVAVPLRVVPSPTGLPSKRCPGIGFLSRAYREIIVFWHVVSPASYVSNFLVRLASQGSPWSPPQGNPSPGGREGPAPSTPIPNELPTATGLAQTLKGAGDQEERAATPSLRPVNLNS